MVFFIGLLTFFLVLDCIALIFLVLIQLPKKEAGAGLAFGGAASDALFGAGSGNVLTKATKYAATIFFALALIIGVLQVNEHRRSVSELEQEVSKQSSSQPVAPTAMPEQPVQPLVTSSNTNSLLLETTPTAAEPTSAPAASMPATNVPGGE